MGHKKEVARNLLAQEPGRVDSRANATFIQAISRSEPARNNSGLPPVYSGKEFSVETTGGDTFSIAVSGRVQWALEQLCRAGTAGCTPLDNPAPRWSAYIFNLRCKGVEIVTLHEPHEGEFAGNHGRYVLRSTVTHAIQGDAI